MIRRHLRSTRPVPLFPYTTLFRSRQADEPLVETPPAVEPDSGGSGHIVVDIDPWSFVVLAGAAALAVAFFAVSSVAADVLTRSEEHTSELQSLMRLSYAVFCLKKQKNIRN